MVPGEWPDRLPSFFALLDLPSPLLTSSLPCSPPCQVYGGLQDYLYLGIGAYCTTVEMNDQKWPDEVDLPRFWKQHRASMYAFLDAYLSQGIMVRFRANEPGDSVVVKAAGASLQVARAFLDLEAGEEVSVHFPVPTGAYKVAAEWQGDDPQHPELAAAEVEVRPDARASLTLARPLPAARGGPMRVAGLVDLSDASSSGPSLVGTANGERREEGVPPSRPGERNYRLNVQGGMTSDRQQPLRDAVLQNLKNRVESTHNASWKRSHRAQECQRQHGALTPPAAWCAHAAVSTRQPATTAGWHGRGGQQAAPVWQ